MMGLGPPGRDILRDIRTVQDGRLPAGRLQSDTMDSDALNGKLDLLDPGGVLRQILLLHGAA